jgi:hypothetical protein
MSQALELVYVESNQTGMLHARSQRRADIIRAHRD